ncbi:MAG: hypothetical protein RH982_04365 [Parvibaculum sp.]
MRIAAILFLSIAAFGSPGCVKSASEYPEATLQIHDVKLASGADHATIKGTYQEGNFWSKPTRATFVAAADGKLELTSGYTTPVPIEPGPHSLVVGYWHGTTRMPVAVRLEAEPGKNYLVLQEDGDLSLDILRGPSRTNYVYIVDEATGEVVVPKTVDLAEMANEYYVEPSGPGTATFRGTVRTEGLFDLYSAYVASVDGKHAPMTPETALEKRRVKYDAAVRLEPGLRAIGIGIRLSTERGLFPILLDVKPGASYVVRLEHGIKRVGTDKWNSATVWVEDEVTGATIVEKTDVPFKRLPF